MRAPESRRTGTILVTGFSAFPGAPANPTEALMRRLEAGRGPRARRLHTAVLPVEWERSWEALRARIEAVRPQGVLMFGLAARAERLRIECLARNRRDPALPDAAGRRAAGPSVMEGPESLPARLPLGKVAAALRRASVDFEWSGDAGAYLCNDTFYRLAAHADALGVATFGFVHTPLTDALLPEWAAAGALPDRCRTLPDEALVDAAEAIVSAVVLATGS